MLHLGNKQNSIILIITIIITIFFFFITSSSLTGTLICQSESPQAPKLLGSSSVLSSLARAKALSMRPASEERV